VLARCAGDAPVLVVSSDQGRTFTRADADLSALDGDVGIAAASASAMCFAGGTFTCSTDGGKTWTAPARPQGVRWLIFQDAHTARAWDQDGMLWTTHDGGMHWSQTPIPGLNPTPALTVLPSSGPAQPAAAPVDLSFTGPDDGWLLASPEAASSPIEHTTDGGAHWSAVASIPALVEHIRFANDQVGYAYGGTQLWMTTDGGQHWAQQPGGAAALGTGDGNVIRIVPTPDGCAPPGCGYAAKTAPVGSTAWSSPVALPHPVGMSAGVQLVRTAGAAYALVTGHTAGGAGTATSALSRSTDGGATWTNLGEPCPQGPAEVDSIAVTAAPTGVLFVACSPRSDASAAQSVITSTDRGDQFVAAAQGSLPIVPWAAADSSHFCLSADTFDCTQDGGANLRRADHAVGGVSPLNGPGQVSWVGFQTAAVGHALDADGMQLWTTRDGGLTWTATPLG
jgi:photosystem II stability/assembly factor-like uncharacterized protein